jgi:hypothetical protein
MFYIIQEEIAGVWGASVLSDPKRMEWLADGTVRIREHVPDNVQEKILFDSQRGDYSGWVQHGAWDLESVQSSGGNQDAFLLNTLWGRDFTLESEVLAQPGSVASLFVRGNPSAMAGYRISLDFARGTVGFYLRFPAQPDQLLQERAVTLQVGVWQHLKVVVQWKFFEIYVNDSLVLVHDQRLYEDGCFGLHAQGVVQFRKVLAYTITEPKWAPPDWNQRCQPRHLFP